MFELRRLLILLSAMGSAAELASAGTILPKDANLLVQQEAAAQDLALLGRFIGASNTALPWSGTISDNGWTYSLSSPYLNGLLTVNAGGMFNNLTDTISWTSSLNFSGSTDPRRIVNISTRGTYTAATVDGFWDTVSDVLGVLEVGAAVLHETATIVFVAGTEAVQIPEEGLAGLGPELIHQSTDFVEGDIEETENELRSDGLKETNGAVRFEENFGPSRGPGLRLPTPFPQPPFAAVQVVSLGQLSGNYANASVSISGTASVSDVPEPSSVALTLLGIGGLAWWRRVCKTRGTKRHRAALLW